MRRIIAALLFGLILVQPVTVKAETIIHRCEATAYSIKGTTATGTQTQEGRTIASKPEWFGCVMNVWFDDGDGIIKSENFIGTYTVEDTGSEPIKTGAVIDIHIADYQRAKSFGRKNVIVQIIKSEG